jgi:hypothetical protein
MQAITAARERHFCRHARPCAGHPRLYGVAAKKDVDGRDKPGHDEVFKKGPILLLAF